MWGGVCSDPANVYILRIINFFIYITLYNCNVLLGVRKKSFQFLRIAFVTDYSFLQTSSEIELSHLSLVALYSEIHPTISHIVHYGINMIAPVYKLQVRHVLYADCCLGDQPLYIVYQLSVLCAEYNIMCL